MAGNWDTFAAETIERRLELARLPEGWAGLGTIVALLALLYLVVFLYRREQRAGVSPRSRMLLTCLRCAVIVTLAVVWLEPVLATYIHRQIESVTLLLVDGSASMGLRDRYADPREHERVLRVLPESNADRLSRAEMVSAVLGRDDARLLDRMAAENAVVLYRFGDEVESLGRLAGPEEPREGRVGGVETAGTASQPAGVSGDLAGGQASEGGRSSLARLAEADAPATDIGRAIRQVVETHAGQPISAVVVFSDGQFNRGEPAEIVGRYARARKIPVHVVGVGDPALPQNVAVLGVEAPPNVFVKDPFKVTAHLRAQGIAGAPLTVELLERAEDADEPRLIDAREVTVAPDGHVAPVVFTHQIGEAAQVRLTVRVARQDNETLTDDNQKEVGVRALENKMRVLLVSGGPSWEYRYLTRLLERDATVNVSCWLQSADADAVRDGNTVIDHFPREREELSGYDCIILLDPQPGDFDPVWTGHVESMITDSGSGLLYVAGRTHAPRFAHDPDTQGLLDLLPVVISAGAADLVINELGHFQQTAWPMNVPAGVADHHVLALSDQPGETARIWERLPGVFWHYPVRREKPVATALLRHSNPRMRNTYGGHVLLATQFVGSGRTAFLGFDTTWRWRRFGDRYFNRFWIQLLRHLVEGKLLTGQKRGLIQVDRTRCAIGEAVTVEARLLDTRHLPLKRDQVEASVMIDGERGGSIVLEPQPDRESWYRGRFVPTRVGTHVFQVDLPGGGGVEPAVIRGEVLVGRPDLEFRQTQLERSSLQTLAAESAGGQYLNIDEVDRLATLVPSQRASLVLTGQPTPLWDRWWTFALLAGLLSVEWALRKRARLL